jgi:hypothetical protein
MYVNGKTDSTADSESVISVNHRNRVRDRTHRLPLFSSVLELVTAGSDTAARTLILRHKLRVRGAEFESAVTNSVPVVNVLYTYQCSTLVQHCAATIHLAVAVRNCSLPATCCSVPYVPVQKTGAVCNNRIGATSLATREYNLL